MEEPHSSPGTQDLWAVHWIRTLPGADDHARAAFASWVRHSARHLEAYLRQKMLSTELRGLDPQRRIDVQELVARARSQIHADGKVVAWPHQVDESFLDKAGSPSAGPVSPSD